jgi:uncharacterized protein YdiU (UPF0061 family)
MWAGKLGLASYSAELVNDLLQLMVRTKVDYTILFRRLAQLAAAMDTAMTDQAAMLKQSFYQPCSAELEAQWCRWLERWGATIKAQGDTDKTAMAMQRLNPAITWREWLVVPAYERAKLWDYSLVQELQALFRNPYEAPPPALAAIYDRRKPGEFFHAGGISHYSCSS